MEAVTVDQRRFPTAPEVITVVGVISQVEVMAEAEEEVTVEIEKEGVVDEAIFEATFEEVVEVVEDLLENRVPGSLRMPPSMKM